MPKRFRTFISIYLLDTYIFAVSKIGQGKPFTNKHTQIICANLGIRLLHSKPFAAWSKGKVERCFYTLQQGFESTLKLPDNRAQSLEELNTKLTHWIQTVYHLRPH